MKWFKFYGQDFQTDPKMGFLNPLQKLMWINLLCIASQDEEHSGIVKFVTEQQLKSLCGVTDNPFNNDWERTDGTLDIFEEMGLIERPDDKTIIIKKFKERQDSNLTDAERAKNYRNRRKNIDVRDKRVTSVTGVSKNSHNRLDKNRLDKNRKEDADADASASADTAASAASSLFEKFWEAYPKKEHKSKAREIWAEKSISVATASLILDFASKASKTDRWKKGFIPCADRFLEEERWTDDVASYADRPTTAKDILKPL